jgi:TonB family protein
LLSLIILVFVATLSLIAAAQNPPKTTPEVAVVKLVTPGYPPLALQARISGDVELKLQIREDGTIESATVVNGHQMLAPAASESARKSTFECRNCTAELTSYSLFYTFTLDKSLCTGSPTQVAVSGNHIVTTGPPVELEIYFGYVASRSPKCLYLWRCGYMWGGMGYYFYPVRSAKCLYLWRCGRHKRPLQAVTCKHVSSGQTPPQ